MKGKVNTHSHLPTKKAIDKDVKHFKSVMLLNSQKDKEERERILAARRKIVVISLLRKGYKTAWALRNKLNTLKEKKARLDSILATKTKTRPSQKLREVMQQHANLFSLKEKLRNVLVSQRYYRKINSLTRNRIDNTKSRSFQPKLHSKTEMDRSKSPGTFKESNIGLLPSINTTTIRVRSVASRPRLKVAGRQTSLVGHIKTITKENSSKLNQKSMNSYSQLNVNINKIKTVKRKKADKKIGVKSNTLQVPAYEDNGLRLPSITYNLRPESQKKQTSDSKFKLSDLKNEECLKGMDESSLRQIYLKLQNLLGKEEKRSSQLTNAKPHKRSIFGRENGQSMPEGNSLDDDESIKLTCDDVSEKSESTDSFDDDLSKNPRYRSILNSIVLGVDEMKNKVSLPAIVKKKNQSVTLTKVLYKVGNLADRSHLISRDNSFYIDNTLVGITWFLEDIYIRGMVIRTKENDDNDIIESCLHGEETPQKRVFEVKQYDSLRSAYFYCKEEKIVSMKFVTANHDIFNVGMSFDLIEDLENIKCFEINQDMKLAKFSSYFDPASKTIQNMSFEFVKF